MKINELKIRQLWLVLVAFLVAATSITFITLNAQPASAACPALPTDKGTATMTVSVPSNGTYRVWSRLMAPDTTNNSYYLEIDDTTCGVNVGDNAFAANSWTWVDHQNGNTSSKVNVTLTAGNHTLRFVGKEAGVKLVEILDNGATDDDEECQVANGQIWTLSYFSSNSLEHPNCTRRRRRCSRMWKRIEAKFRRMNYE